MPYVGNEPSSNFVSVTKDLFSGDGSTVAFTLSKIATTNGVAVFVENVRQEPTIAYAVSGTTLTFTAAPVTSSGNNIYVLHHNAPASTATHPSAQALTATSGTFTGDVSIDGGSFVFNESSADKDFRVESNGNANMLFVDAGDDRVGVGATPSYTLDVYANSANNPASRIFHDGNNANRKGIIVQCGTDDASGTNYAISVDSGNGTGQGSITFSGGTVTYGAFTAHHEISLPDADKSDGYAYGTLVEIDEIYYCKNQDSTDAERGIRYLVKKSQSAYSRKVLGAYSGDMLEVADEDGTYANNLHQASILGDGHIICNGEKGNIAIGDGICTSSTVGVGMKADKMAMIIGIAQKDTTFSSASETKLVAVQYGVRQFTPWTD